MNGGTAAPFTTVYVTNFGEAYRAECQSHPHCEWRDTFPSHDEAMAAAREHMESHRSAL